MLRAGESTKGEGLSARQGVRRELPAVLETPVEKEGDDARNLAAVRELFKRSQRRTLPKARKPARPRKSARRKK